MARGSGHRRRRRRIAACALAAALAAAGLGQEAAAEGLRLGWPVGCAFGETCWIVNYVDHEPGPGLRDYACGTATYNAPPHDRHQGTDIAVRDLGAMRAGVAVHAAADGVVLGARDGMADVSVREAGAPAVDGRECGNGVRLDHGGGWTSQYCHLRRGSITVRPGARVHAGDRLGLIGLSGATEYPHLHFQVEKDGVFVDPFVGLSGAVACGPGEAPLWRAEVLAALLPYQPTALYSAGFATGAPDIALVRDGRAHVERLPRDAEALVLWVDIFNVRTGDVVALRIVDPAGGTLFEHRDTLAKDQARRFVYGGTRRKVAAWPVGGYTGTIRLIRAAAGPGGPTELVAEARVVIE